MTTRRITRMVRLCYGFVPAILFGIALSFAWQTGSGHDETPTPMPDSTPTVDVADTELDTNTTTKDILASDDFRDPGSGWPNALVFDNYYIGYHEPDYYHVEVKVAEDKAVAVLPGQTFDDATIETGVFRDAANTSPTGDFRYGLVARRAGSRFYAFAISPRTQRWYVLKSTPTSLDLLDAGSSSMIKEEGQTDRLRLDAQGSALSFFINDELVSQVDDADYSQGEVGFYVETLDAPRAHIHFDNFQVSKLSQQSRECQVVVPYLNVRSGPGTAYQPPIGLVQSGDRVEPSGQNEEGSWIYVQVVGGALTGWVSASPTYVRCEELPLRLPVRAAPLMR